MTVESDRREIRLLERILRDATRLQETQGRLRDPMSWREIALFRRQLEALQAQAKQDESGAAAPASRQGSRTILRLGLPRMAERCDSHTDFDSWWESDADEEWEVLRAARIDRPAS